MKVLAFLIVLLVSSAASAQTFDATLDRMQANNLAERDELIATRSELQQVKLKAATAIEANIKQNAAFHGQIKAKDKVIAKQSKVLDKWYVRLVIQIANWIFWLAIATGLAYGTAFIGGFFRPHTIIFKVAQWLISALPAANVVEAWHPTTVVKTITTPVVEPPAVVTKSPANSQVAANLAAMAEGNARTDAPAVQPIDFNTNLGWAYAKPSEPKVGA